MIKYQGLDVFIFDLFRLIDDGYKETKTKIYEEINKNNLFSYLIDKYNNKLTTNYYTYKIDELNDYFYNCVDINKKGVNKEENGLLLVLALIVDGMQLIRE
ncbi:hypothetical protein RBU49_03000 [Clostridium sp. MB40-C1]|uniref:hypothetical protein n=1 Tax=Clostridium sp. MB40-C1 TaxID=3070996 RepID=UPI0027E08A24|nr:hypothetical protein [Clostridium sp. MB40-C1]WMJ81238.1 hypothetical protein RBU49_03000 [Clostridium sp. MB40-C1]